MDLTDGMLPSDQLGDRVRFLLELDRLKTVRRRARITDRTRLETAAEHSWHVAMFALVLAPHADETIDLDRVVRMLLVHAVAAVGGRTSLCDTARRPCDPLDGPDSGGPDAERLFDPLPGEDGSRLHALWTEFAAGKTPEARFAAAVDRLEPLLLHLVDQGRIWGDHGIGPTRVQGSGSRAGTWAWCTWLGLATTPERVSAPCRPARPACR